MHMHSQHTKKKDETNINSKVCAAYRKVSNSGTNENLGALYMH